MAEQVNNLPIFEKAGAIVIDNSSQWRMTNDVDLIVPEVNQPEFKRGIIANLTAQQFSRSCHLKFYTMLLD